LLKDRYRIKAVKSGEKAIELAKSAPVPDLILLDVIMPGMNGFEVCDRLKSDPITANIPVIFLTALNEASDETTGLRKGGADFITKPFHGEVVLARINTHLELQAERRKSESLLRNVLPENVVRQLMLKGQYRPEVHSGVSILFTDFVGFTDVAASLPPQALIEELSEIFSAFDSITEKHGSTRIKTIGDAYMAATGLDHDDPDHANRLAETALEFIDYLKERNASAKHQWKCRAGIHSGNVIAAIIGKTRYLYDILGDDVNIASRVEAAGKEMELTVTEATLKLLDKRFRSSSLGSVELKRKGKMELFLVSRS
jgi:class 3 adenylate cyclase